MLSQEGAEGFKENLSIQALQWVFYTLGECLWDNTLEDPEKEEDQLFTSKC